jgi:adenosylhomocysteine nucleosidase
MPRLIAIMSAMPEEVSQLLSQLEPTASAEKQSPNVRNHAGRNYHSGTLWGVPVVVVFSRWGKVAAASTATHVIDTYSPYEVIFTGVAGAIDPDLSIGDLVVADNLIHHDMDASPMFPRHEIPLLGITRIPATSRVTEGLRRAAQRFLKQDFGDAISAELRSEFGLSSPQAIIGEVASGDTFVADASQANRIRSILPGSLCVEMEGAAVAQVCWEHSQDFGVLRTISDRADSKAQVDFPSFIANIASPYSFGVLQQYLAEISANDTT